MNNFIGKQGLQLLLGGMLVMVATLAQAQYVWINEKGIKQFSDKAPPTSVPLNKILKQPGGLQVQAAAMGTQPAGAPAPAPAAAKPAPMSLAEKEMDYRKRQTEKAENEKKTLAENEQKAARQSNCEAARASKAQLDSGNRISTTDKNGERGYMDENQRAARQAQTNKALASCNE